MVRGIIKGIKAIKSDDVIREVGLAIVAGVVSWGVAELLIKYKEKKAEKRGTVVK